MNDGILVQVQTALEDLLDLRHLDILHDDLAVRLPVLLELCLVGLGHLASILGLTARGIEEVTIQDIAVTYVDHLFKL